MSSAEQLLQFNESIRAEPLLPFTITPVKPVETLTAKELFFIHQLDKITAEHHHDLLFNSSVAAKLLATSQRQLHRKLTQLFQKNFTQYLGQYRLARALPLLKTGLQIVLICDMVGFSSPSYFAKCFKKTYGITPKQFQQGKR
ncbi:helix-turn-helix transcriptional regulator [Thalassomonas actiniarum]|uniref:Helix-turn-helix transcriptional regulator n=1 Tax=Thalassomonas actiniarum TaxID=485447 RepID=A0AAE9YNN5_9GAMM|nr:helix-turn-helix transcriptional regulator [Thalassomonas actiniarum]WDD96767.1 helix-turn-helix transcriptional regulator [Thalassomonas actiniarum]